MSVWLLFLNLTIVVITKQSQFSQLKYILNSRVTLFIAENVKFVLQMSNKYQKKKVGHCAGQFKAVKRCEFSKEDQHNKIE